MGWPISLTPRPSSSPLLQQTTAAVGEGDNLDLAQQLKGAQHEAAHARWERDRATHALAKMRKKLQTAQSAWEEERSVVQARILELEVNSHIRLVAVANKC